MAAGWRVLGRVAEQVADDLLDVGRLAGDDRQVAARARSSTEIVGSSRRLVGDDALEQPARLERLGLDLEATALDAAQDEQVLDEAVQSLGLRADVLQQGRREASSSVRPGRARIWVSPRIVVIGVRSS